MTVFLMMGVGAMGSGGDESLTSQGEIWDAIGVVVFTADFNTSWGDWAIVSWNIAYQSSLKNL